MPRRFRGILIFLVLAAAGGAFLQWGLPLLLKEPTITRLPPGAKPPGGPEAEILPVPVRTFKASRIEFKDILPTLGTIRGQVEVDLKFEVSGVVKTIDFREGDLVSQDQVLAALDDRDAALRLEYAQSKRSAAEAQLRLAEKKYEINEKLFELGAIIRAKLEESELEKGVAEAQLDTSEKEVALAEAELSKTTLEAPIEGVMGTREVEVGELVSMNPPTVVATLMDVGTVFVELGIIERDIERIRLGQKVKVSVDSLPNASFDGTIDNLAPLIEGKSRTLTAKVRVENAQGQLLPGMFARAEVAVFEKPDALVVPTSSLKDTDGDGKFESVFVVEGDAAKLKAITLGYLTTDYAEVTEGLSEGDLVVSEARGPLTDGSKVTLLEEEEAGVQRVEPAITEEKEVES